MKRHFNALSYLMHVNLYTTSNHAIDLCVYMIMCIYTKPKYKVKKIRE